jgi:hypothetical protein
MAGPLSNAEARKAACITTGRAPTSANKSKAKKKEGAKVGAKVES